MGELLVVLVIGLLILGPEELPVVARNLGRTWATVTRHFRTVQTELSRFWHET